MSLRWMVASPQRAVLTVAVLTIWIQGLIHRLIVMSRTIWVEPRLVGSYVMGFHEKGFRDNGRPPEVQWEPFGR